jgi:3-phenylpropionate/cinnamic acid dioxygenase small subunit
MSDRLALATQFLRAEAAALDERRWDDWLGMFDEKAQYWVPAWKSEEEQTDDPTREISLIYYADRSGLEERIWRVRTRRSVASMVLPRTLHAIHNVTLLPDSTHDTYNITCGWTVHQFLPKEGTVEIFFGRYHQTLKRAGEQLRITSKKIVLLNDLLPAKIDFYSL